MRLMVSLADATVAQVWAVSPRLKRLGLRPTFYDLRLQRASHGLPRHACDSAAERRNLLMSLCAFKAAVCVDHAHSRGAQTSRFVSSYAASMRLRAHMQIPPLRYGMTNMILG